MSDEVRHRRQRVLDLLTRSSRMRNETANDLWVMRDVFPGVRGGYFVECGAGDGVVGSSCYPLERRLGWRGICVEPHGRAFAELRRNRPHSICFDVCVGRCAGEVEFLEGRPGRSGARWYSGIAANVARRSSFGTRADLEFDRVTKRVVPIGELLRAANAPPVVDYLAVDVEGSELDVLEAFPFDDHAVRALSVECDGRVWDDVEALLGGRGFVEVDNRFNRGRPWERYWLDPLTAASV